MRRLLIEFLKHHPQGTKINLREVQRDGEIGDSYTRIWNLYTEISKEQEVPPVKKNSGNKS